MPSFAIVYFIVVYFHIQKDGTSSNNSTAVTSNMNWKVTNWRFLFYAQRVSLLYFRHPWFCVKDRLALAWRSCECWLAVESSSALPEHSKHAINQLLSAHYLNPETYQSFLSVLVLRLFWIIHCGALCIGRQFGVNFTAIVADLSSTSIYQWLIVHAPTMWLIVPDWPWSASHYNNPILTWPWARLSKSAVVPLVCCQC